MNQKQGITVIVLLSLILLVSTIGLFTNDNTSVEISPSPTTLPTTVSVTSTSPTTAVTSQMTTVSTIPQTTVTTSTTAVQVGLAPTDLNYYTFINPRPTLLIDYSKDVLINYDILKTETVVIAVPNQAFGEWEIKTMVGCFPLGFKKEAEMTYFGFKFIPTSSIAQVKLAIDFEGNEVVFVITDFILN